MNYEDQTEYAFKYTDCGGKTYTSQFENPGPTWMEALDDFINFLESVFKYDIRSEIRLQEPAYQKSVKQDRSYIDPWKGEYFTKNEEEE